jgi:hypothetical protein
MLGNSSDVRIAKNRGGGFAAIGTIEAVEGLEHLIVFFVKPNIQVFVFSILVQKGFNLLPLSFAFIQP